MSDSTAYWLGVLCGYLSGLLTVVSAYFVRRFWQAP